ncbi:hypothetical protein SVEN_0603 [Streptomyces venezuelae ATCC 10712]|uniref:Uncharacterized protein n=1 Tax=Streptomyces venezuelae (strain ATCC 10712 / CBS 650.69 / DSM 40230 / JCM 4526 / NBRC 13096 / PD 04745) TaxID=953739 RepID=F2R8H2_STRVP|nr:hypothetical protein SVEN_0603 [Streptomyces venezuelae ATCC 10712]
MAHEPGRGRWQGHRPRPSRGSVRYIGSGKMSLMLQATLKQGGREQASGSVSRVWSARI